MQFIQLVYEHPWITVLLLIVIGECLEDCIKAFRKRAPEAKEPPHAR